MWSPWVTAIIVLVLLFIREKRRRSRVEETAARFEDTFHPEGHTDGFVDVLFSISKHVVTDDIHWFTLEAWHDKLLIGIMVGLPGEIPPGLDPHGNIKGGLLTDGVRLRSIGTQSDGFIAALDQLYATNLAPRKFTSRELNLTAYSLNQEPLALSLPTTGRLKVFLESKEGDYAEIYLNFDTKNACAELSEKDPDYRAPLIRILAAQ
jgi:hypothetical protein